MLLSSSTSLPSGLRVRLRLLHASDRPGLRRLYETVGLELDDVAMSRLIRTDPRHRTACVASAWLGGQDTIVGFGLGDLDDDPELVIVDTVAGGELVGVLAAALAERGAAVRRVA